MPHLTHWPCLLIAAALAVGCTAQPPASAATRQSTTDATSETASVAETGGYSVPVRMTRYSDDRLCSFGQSVADPTGLDVHAGPSAEAEVVDRLPADYTVFMCEISEDEQWLGIVHDKGLEQSLSCRGSGQDCDLSEQCALTDLSEEGMPYTGPCHIGWIRADATYSLTD